MQERNGEVNLKMGSVTLHGHIALLFMSTKNSDFQKNIEELRNYFNAF